MQIIFFEIRCAAKEGDHEDGLEFLYEILKFSFQRFFNFCYKKVLSFSCFKSWLRSCSKPFNESHKLQMFFKDAAICVRLTNYQQFCETENSIFSLVKHIA